MHGKCSLAMNHSYSSYLLQIFTTFNYLTPLLRVHHGKKSNMRGARKTAKCKSACIADNRVPIHLKHYFQDKSHLRCDHFTEKLFVLWFKKNLKHKKHTVIQSAHINSDHFIFYYPSISHTIFIWIMKTKLLSNKHQIVLIHYLNSCTLRASSHLSLTEPKNTYCVKINPTWNINHPERAIKKAE